MAKRHCTIGSWGWAVSDVITGLSQSVGCETAPDMVVEPLA